MNEHDLKLTETELAVVEQALQDAPFRFAYPILFKINQHRAASDAAAQAEKVTGNGD